MTNVVGNPIDFPLRMEYGEVLSESYQLVQGNIEMFQRLLSKDSEAKLTSYVTTTLGELYKSEPYQIKDIVKQRQYVR